MIASPSNLGTNGMPAMPGSDWSLVLRRSVVLAGLLLIRVPTFSPRTARRMLPSLRKLNTRIGMLCSMQWAMAVLSITRRFCSRTVL